CTANCGLCGRVVMRRVCRSGTCPGANTMTSTTRCGASSFCAFGLGLPSCCEPAKRAIVNGVLTCA
uniref:Uncharacterized protein n=1 Tax=Panagrolaimus sp. ES5 TaxID=591445 RepID=A0AC34GFF4_9BILA